MNCQGKQQEVEQDKASTAIDTSELLCEHLQVQVAETLRQYRTTGRQ